MISRYFLFFMLVVLLAAGGCKKTDNQTQIIYFYTGSGAAGDVIDFTVNQSGLGYSIYNETYKQYDNGYFTTYSGELNGLYKIFARGSFYYGVELPGQVFGGCFPTARTENSLSYGVSLQTNTSNPLISGNYVYLRISNAAINGSTVNREWGILSILPNGTWMKQGYCNAPGILPMLMPDEYTGPVPPLNMADSGTWIVDTVSPGRFQMTRLNKTDTVSGFPFATDSGAVFVMDLGFRKGFLFGLKLLDGNINTMKGSYGYADVQYDASTGGGKFAVSDSSQALDWWRGNAYGKITNGLFGGVNQAGVLKNVFFAKNVDLNGETVDFYSVVSGPFFMEFQFRQNNFRSYGIGARLP